MLMDSIVDITYLSSVISGSVCSVAGIMDNIYYINGLISCFLPYEIFAFWDMDSTNLQLSWKIVTLVYVKFGGI